MSREALAAYAQRLRSLRSMPTEAAKDAAPLVEASVRETASAGTTTDGKTWAPKKDGARALPNAASAIKAVATGAAVIVRLTGAYVFHHYSKNEKYRRRILPDSGAGLPPRIAEALAEAARRAFARMTSR